MVEGLRRAPSCSPCSGRAGAATPRPRVRRGCGAAGTAGSGARGCAGTRRRAQRLAVLAADVAVAGELGQGAERGGLADLRVGPAVDELEQLDRELDVPEPARAELELTLGVVGGDVVDHPAAHRLGVLDEPVPLDRAPHHRLDHGDVLPAELEIAGDSARLEQSLELPGAGPPLVVALVAGEGAGQRAGLALGPQRRVDRPDGPLAGLLRADPHQVAGELGGDLERLVRVRAVPGLVHEDHVHVGDVVELVAAALAHRDDREPGQVGPLPHPPPGNGQGRVEGAGREVGELGGNVVDPEVVGQVAGGQAEQEPAVLDAQRVHGLVVGRRLGHRAQEILPDGVRRGAGRAHRGIRELAPVRGVPGQVIGQGLAGAEDREQAHRGALVVDERLEQLLRLGLPELLARRLHQPNQRGQREVGVRGAGDQREQRLGRARDGVEVVERVLGIVEAEPGQLALRGGGSGVRHVRAPGSGALVPAPRRRSRRPGAPTRGPAPPGPP